MTTDRRILRTRGLLRDALLALIAERGYDALTIEDITARANVRRATFYDHYRDRDDLLFAVLTETFDALAAQMEAGRTRDALAGKTQADTFLAVFRHAEAHRALYRALLGGGAGAAVARRIREYLAGLLLAALHAAAPEALHVPPEVVAQFAAGAELALITWWLENDLPYSAEDMARMAHRLVLTGALGAFPTDARAALAADSAPPLDG